MRFRGKDQAGERLLRGERGRGEEEWSGGGVQCDFKERPGRQEVVEEGKEKRRGRGGEGAIKRKRPGWQAGGG